MTKERILIKISGGSLKSETDIFDYKKIENLALQLKELHKKYNISLVIGGGNIFRGNVCEQFNINREDADNMGMLATMINGICLENVFKKHGINCKLFSALKIDAIIDEYTNRSVNEALKNDTLCIFVGGTGSPYFTTDTGAALRAAETSSNWILMGKNNADGVYDKDPNKYSDAKHIPYLQYNEIIEKNIQVMDHSALTLCHDNNIKIIIFNISRPNSLVDAMNKKIQVTIISKENNNDWLK